MLVGGLSVQNLLTIKAVLRSFEFPSYLKVNFAKSCLFGFNMGRSFGDKAEGYLQCK